MNQLIIIGAGPMGLYAAFCAGMRDINGLVLESSYTYGGQIIALYGQKRIYDIPGFYNTKGIDFVEGLYKQYTRYEEALPIKYNTMVTEIIQESDHFIINTTTGTYYSKKVLITNGGGNFKPTPLEAVGYIDQDNVLYHIEDINVFKNKKVAIVGGGDSAADWANELTEIANEVSLIHRRNNFRAHQATINMFNEKGKIITPYQVVEVIGQNKINKIVLKKVRTDEKLIIDVDYLLVFYGVNNERSALENWSVNYNNDGIIVDSTMQTNVKVFPSTLTIPTHSPPHPHHAPTHL